MTVEHIGNMVIAVAFGVPVLVLILFIVVLLWRLAFAIITNTWDELVWWWREWWNY